MQHHHTLPSVLLAAPASLAPIASAAATDTNSVSPPPTALPEMVVTGRADSLVGVADSASQGTVGAVQLEQRPKSRPGEILETVPGLIATQHSGAGKANQYYLRGFNLDHGTDFATSLEGMPINLPTHAHGQGYTDMNPIIPELVERVNFRKGPYFADSGDFSSAGAADIQYFRELPEGLARFEAGSFHYLRGVVADAQRVGEGSLLYGPGVTVHDANGFYGSLRLRYFGPRPLIEDNSVTSDGTARLSTEVGHQLSKHWSVSLQAYNLLDEENSDIDYHYTSQMAGEAAPVDDIHFHPAEPFALRGVLTCRF